MDYSKYMPQGGSKKSGSQGGDYQQYMDYQKFMLQGGNKHDVDGGSTNKVGNDATISLVATELTDASVSASAPVIALAASSDDVDAKSAHATPSDLSSAIVPLVASAAVETASVSKMSLRAGWQTLVFLTAALLASGVD